VTARRATEPGAQLAFDIFVDRILGFVGSYWLKLGGALDALVFSGGIGEHSVELRKAVVDRCACLGCAISARANEGVDRETTRHVVDVGMSSVAPRVLVCRTDEQVGSLRRTRLLLFVLIYFYFFSLSFCSWRWRESAHSSPGFGNERCDGAVCLLMRGQRGRTSYSIVMFRSWDMPRVID